MKVEKELESKKSELERIEKALNFKIGDYVEIQAFGRRFVGIVRSIPNEKNGNLAIEVRNGVNTPTEIPSEALIEKWQPKRGDMCIFWDKCSKNKAIISVYLLNTADSKFPYRANNTVYTDCIPFISEKQFKEHIGYEEC